MNENLLHELTARLPELEWKVNSLGASLSTNCLPKGLFQARLDMNATTCIAEIREDLRRLERIKNDNSAHYLACRIQRKISVLVTLCHLQLKKPKSEGKAVFGLDKISTRQQWIQSLEKEISHLSMQRDALTISLTQLKARGAAEGVLQVQAELGELEKRLTLANEMLSG